MTIRYICSLIKLLKYRFRVKVTSGVKRKKYKEKRNQLKKQLKYLKYNHNKTRKHVIYSCITGNYDSVPEYLYFDDNFDYILYTDNKLLQEQKIAGIWKIRPLVYEDKDDVRNARWHKTHPHILFPEYDTSTWIDANIIPVKNFIFSQIKKCIKTNTLISVPLHPDRQDCYEEGEFLIKRHYDLPELIHSEIELIKQDRYPAKQGLHETNIIFRRHKKSEIEAANEEWWSLIANYSRRDQVSFNYIFWKHKITVSAFSEKFEIRFNPKQVILIKHSNYKRPQVKDCKTISIIVPVFNALPETKDLIASIEKSNLTSNVDITLINDKSDDETTEYLRKLNKKNPKYKLIENETNMQFVRTCNKGMTCVDGDIIVLLNNDTLMPQKWEKRILECFNSDVSIGVASPIASGSGLWDIPFKQGMNFDDMDRHVESISHKNYPVVLCPEGFCFAIRRECFEEIGLLDEIFCPIYCEETDYALRALKAGWKTVIIDNLYMYHKRHASVGSEFRRKQIEKNRKILMQRHSDIWAIRESKYNTAEIIKKIKDRIVQA